MKEGLRYITLKLLEMYARTFRPWGQAGCVALVTYLLCKYSDINVLLIGVIVPSVWVGSLMYFLYKTYLEDM